MVRRGTLLVAFAMLVCGGIASTAREHDNLERGEDDHDSYYRAIRTILWQGWRRDVVLRMIVRPPFDKEDIVGVRRVADEYRCFVVNPTSHIWSEEVKSLERKKPDFSHIRGKFEETPVREDIVKRIAAIWRKGINDPKSYLPPSEKARVIHVDSTEYYFFVGMLNNEHLTAHTVESDGRNAAAMLRVGIGLPIYVWHGISEDSYSKTLENGESSVGIKQAWGFIR